MGIRTVSRSIHEKMIRIPAHNVRKCHGAGLIIDLSCKIIVKSVSRLILSLFSMFLSVLTFAQGGLSTDFEKLVYKRDGNSLPYRLLKPEQPEPGKKYPLIVFLHGAGERGTDNEVHIDHVTGLFLNPHNRKKFPCYVLAPQCPKNVMWASHDREGNMKSSPSAIMQLVIGLMDKTEKAFPIDPSRIYITGLSMGGYGTWELIARFPDRFAAAVPVCGGGDPATAARISHVPVWAFHGSHDTTVRPANSRKMIRALQAAGAKPGYTEYPDVGHDSWVYAYREPYLLPWMFEKGLDKNSEGN